MSAITEIKKCSNLHINIYKNSNHFQLNKNYYLNAMQTAKCLAIISCIGCLISSALLPAIACGTVGLIASTIKNTIKNTQNTQIKNIFTFLLTNPPALQANQAKEALVTNEKHQKIAFLLLVYSCLDQLAFSCEKQKNNNLKELGSHCRAKADEIRKRKDIKEISTIMDGSVAAASSIQKVLSNVNALSEAIFCYTPSDVMKVIAEICDALASDALASDKEKASFESDAKKAITFAEQVKNVHVTNIRDSIRKNLIDNLQPL